MLRQTWIAVRGVAEARRKVHLRQIDVEGRVAIRFMRQRAGDVAAAGVHFHRQSIGARLLADADLADIAECVHRVSAFAERSVDRLGRQIRDTRTERVGHRAGLILRRQVDRLRPPAAERAEITELRERRFRDEQRVVDGAAAIGVHFHDRRHLKAARGVDGKEQDDGEADDSHPHTMP